MHILVLGGCGEIGEKVIRELVKSTEVTKIIIADIFIAKAKSLAKELGEKVSALQVDITNHDELVKALRSADVVVNCAGPFYKFGVPIVKAAVEARVNYVDIDDDYLSTKELLDDAELNKSAKDAGITVIIGLGVTPGLSNIVAKYGAGKLDNTEEINVTWVVTSTESQMTPASMAHMLFALAHGKVPTYEDGKWINVKPLADGAEKINLPAPFGEVEVYHCGHGEPISLPHYIKNVKKVSCKIGFIPPEIREMYTFMNDFGFTRTEPIRVRDISVTPFDVTIANLPYIPEETIARTFKLEETVPAFVCQVSVKGKKSGHPTEFVYKYFAESHVKATFLPPALCAVMLGRKEIESTGVMAPEGCINPAPFLKEMASRGIVWSETSITTSFIE